MDDPFLSLPAHRRFQNIYLNDYSILEEEDEEPLLKELGFDFDHIKRKMLVVMNPFTRELDEELRTDCDLTGPLVLCLILGMIQTVSLKWTFDYIYGYSFAGSIAIWILVNLMNDPRIDKSVGFYQTISILGYSLFPIILLATLSIFISLDTIYGLGVTMGTIAWATSSSSMMFSMKDKRLLLAYPLGMYYTCFALLTVF